MEFSLKSTLQLLHKYYGESTEIAKIEKIGKIEDANLKKYLAIYGVKEGGYLLMQASAWSEFGFFDNMPEKFKVYSVTEKQYNNMFYNRNDNAYIDIEYELQNPNGMLSRPVELTFEQAEKVALVDVIPIPYEKQIQLERELKDFEDIGEIQKVQSYLDDWRRLRYLKHKPNVDYFLNNIKKPKSFIKKNHNKDDGLSR